MTHTIAGTGTIAFEAIPAAELEEIRAAGRDEAGNSLAVQADDGGSPLRAEAAIAELLARPGIELVHLRNVEYGCCNFAVARG
jgi:Protein of unknown function (DUF1203)